MPLKQLSESPHGPRFRSAVRREGEVRKTWVATNYEEWGQRFWNRMTPLQQQQQALVELQNLHTARFNLESLDRYWRIEALTLLGDQGFGMDWAEHPRERPELASMRVRTIMIGWAIVESGYALGEIHFDPRDQHPALVEFSSLNIQGKIRCPFRENPVLADLPPSWRLPNR